MRVHVDDSLPAWRTRAAAVPWTGHQPWLWHPGILAKYLAADALTSGNDAETVPGVHVVVDHDVQEALRLELPTQDGHALGIRRVTLAQTQAEVPPACQPPVDVEQVLQALRDESTETIVDVSRLSASFDREDVRHANNLGQQVAAVLRALLSPWLARPMRDVYSSQLSREAWFRAELRRLLHDAPAMALAYNRAVAEHSSAGVTPLRVEPDRVELPVWLLAWEQPRRRLFADVADSEPWLVTEDGTRIDPESAWLAPKALWMTALLRRRVDQCAGFIHGTGGGDYDRAMEAWWSAWKNETLAPQAVVTADVTLPVRAPVADRAQVERAVWVAHHLPHNLDRVPSIAAGHPDLVNEKRVLLERMDDDRNRVRRRTAFDRVHVINDALADAHHALIDRAGTELNTARTGLSNAAVAGKRDWCFALYPEAVLASLRDTIHSSVDCLSAADRRR